MLVPAQNLALAPVRFPRAGSAFGGSPALTSPVAVCSGLTAGVALAACAFALPSPGADNTIELQLTPAGEFKPRDGREMKVAAWRINADIAARAIAATTARKTEPVLDYEHQTLKVDDNGQPAPAAGWIKGLTWREGQGLFATVQLTARAKQHIQDGEYRYVSPVFAYHPKTGDVLDIRMAALTNNPAIDGMEPLALRAAASYGFTLEEDSPMNKLLLAVATMLALGANATEDQALAALTAAKPKLDGFDGFAKAFSLADDAKPEAVIAACTARMHEFAGMRAALGLDAAVAGDAAIAACTSIKAKADTSAVDPAKFVPISVVESLKADLAVLTAKHRDGEVGDLVEQGLADGRLLPAQKEWATELGKANVAALTAYLKSAEPIAALRATQTQGRHPGLSGDAAHGLTADELAVCSATGISAEEFAKTKKAA
jgi:phage I-like protein